MEEKEFKEATPIYLQLMAQIRCDIASGKRKPGQRVESVRDMAVSCGVNPNTAQRALSELEREGLLYSERTSGRYVTKDSVRIGELRERMAEELASRFFAEMEQIGYDKDEAVKLLGKKRQAAGRGSEIWTA